MLSPETFHEDVPRDPAGNLEKRAAVLGYAPTDARFRRDAVEACRLDILLFTNLFVWTYDPRLPPPDKVGPFVTWDFQDEALKEILAAIEGQRDLVIEKSRDMGASWMCLIAVTWLWLFHPWNKFLVVSRSKEAVDRSGDPDCLFWKIDHLLDHLPPWLMPRGWDRKRHRSDMKFLNPENGSTITGQASTGKAGVGGRATAIFVDEFSQIREDFQVLGRTADTSGCRIFNFTHTGLGTAAYALTDPKSAAYSFTRKLQLHWSKHPGKNKGLYRHDPASDAPNKVVVLDKKYQYPPDFQFVMDGSPTGGPFPALRSPWYDAECKRPGRSQRDVAMDLDINPQGSVSQFFNAVRVRELQRLYGRDPFWEGEVSFDRSTGQPLGLVEVPNGRLKLWAYPDHDGKFTKARYTAGCDPAAGTGATPTCLSVLNAETGEKVAEYANPNVSPDEFAPLAVALCRLFADPEGRGAYLAWEHAGPGIKLGQRIVELGYRSIYYRTDESGLAKEVTEQIGWYPHPKMKRLLLEDYRAALDAEKFVNRSIPALDETLAFQYTDRDDVVHSGEKNDEDPSGSRVNHGDRVIADALAWMLARGTPKRKPEEERRVENHPGSLAGRRWLEDQKRRQAEAWA